MKSLNNVSTAIILTAIGYLAFLGFFESSTVTNIAIVQAASLGVYWDVDCSKEAKSIDWGSLYPGSSRKIDIYIRNEGNATTHISLTTAEWKPPEASEYISLDWNYTGQTIKPNDVIQIAFNLSISSNIKEISTFSFNIVISAEDAPQIPPPPPPPPDITPPRIYITTPEPGAVIDGSDLLVVWFGIDSESGIDHYSVYVNGRLETETRNPRCQLLGLPKGSNNITVVAYDKAGNVGIDEITVTLDNIIGMDL